MITNWKLWLRISIVILIFLIGILAGIQIGTYALIDHVASGLSGSTFIININETKLVDYTLEKYNETILPQIKKEMKG